MTRPTAPATGGKTQKRELDFLFSEIQVRKFGPDKLAGLWLDGTGSWLTKKKSFSYFKKNNAADFKNEQVAEKDTRLAKKGGKR